MKRSAVFFATVLCFLTLLPAQRSVWAKDNWLSVRSKNFFLIGNASEKEIRQVGTRLEQFREVFSRLFTRTKLASPVPTTVIVFKNDKSYAPFKPNPNVAGYFQPGPDVNYITLSAEARGVGQRPFNVIFHEYTHLLVKNNSGNVPVWFNEGLAEYYSTVHVTDEQKFELGNPISHHVYLLREKRMLPLITLFQVDQHSPYYNERDKQSVFYAQSWALVHYLILGKSGQRVTRIGKFLDSLSANVPMEQAFQRAFELSFEQMEKELEEYIRNDRYPIMSGKFEQKIGTDTEMHAALISEAEAQAYLGDLLLHSNRAEAEGYLKKALELDPHLAMAHASLGMLRVREGKLDEARKSLERAVAANSQNYLIHYYYAYALSREGMDQGEMLSAYAPETEAKMRAELKKAIELRPDYPESYSLLAFLNLVTGSQLDESIELLKRALVVSPGRNDLAFMLAQVYVRKEDYKAARDLLEKLGVNNADEEVRRRAAALLAQIVLTEEQLARFRAEGNGPRAGSPGTGGFQQTEVVRNADPSFFLREALRKPGAGEMQVQGMLSRIDCDSKGIVFVVKVSGRQLNVKTTRFEDIDITSYSANAGREITCGPRKPEDDVVLDYVPAADSRSKINGVVKSIEFVPNDFRLKAEP